MQTKSGIELAFAITFLACGLFTGCNQQEPAEKKTDPPAKKEGLAARLDAAKAIAGNSQRDEALAKVAKDASQALNAKVAQQAVQAIRGTNLHDEAASEAAEILAKAGKTAEATSMAKLIASDNLRDDTLSRIAKDSE